MDIEKLIEQLKNLEACAYGYHINGEVLGMDCSDFEQIMVDAADEISKVSTLQAENEQLRAELEQVKRERDEAIKTIFKWTGCPECKYWNSAEEWCEKHDREAGSCDGCDSPQWRGPDKEE